MGTLRFHYALFLELNLEYHQLIEIIKVKLYHPEFLGTSLASDSIILVHEVAFSITHFVINDGVHVLSIALGIRDISLLRFGA